MFSNIKRYIALVYRSPVKVVFNLLAPSDFEELLTKTEALKPNIIVRLVDYYHGGALIPTHLKVLNLIDALTLSYRLRQLINETTNIPPNHPNLI